MCSTSVYATRFQQSVCATHRRVIDGVRSDTTPGPWVWRSDDRLCKQEVEQCGEELLDGGEGTLGCCVGDREVQRILVREGVRASERPPPAQAFGQHEEYQWTSDEVGYSTTALRSRVQVDTRQGECGSGFSEPDMRIQEKKRDFSLSRSGES